METKQGHEVVVRTVAPAGLIGIGTLIRPDHGLIAAFGLVGKWSKLEVDATVKVLGRDEAQLRGLTLALNGVMSTNPEWGLKGIASGPALWRMDPIETPEAKAEADGRTVAAVISALDSLDADNRRRAICEWVKSANADEVAVLIGWIVAINTTRVIEREVAKALQRRAQP